MINRVHNIDTFDKLSLPHAISIQKPCSRASKKCGNRVKNNKFCSSKSLGPTLEHLSYPERNPYRCCASIAVRFYNVASCVWTGSVPVSIVQESIVGLVHPLPKYGVERSRGGDYHSKWDWEVYWEERAQTHHPRNEFASVWMNSCRNYCLCCANFLYLFLWHHDLSRSCLFKLIFLLFLLSIDKGFHL